MSTETFHAIKNLLDEHSITYREVHHEPTPTSAEAAKARGEDISIGGKAILLKVGKVFNLFVLSAALKVDSARIKAHFKAKKLRFASPEELLDLTGLVPGSFPNKLIMGTMAWFGLSLLTMLMFGGGAMGE